MVKNKRTKAPEKPPENPVVELIRKLVARTTKGDLKWEQYGVSQTYKAPLKNDCHLNLSSGFLRVQSVDGNKKVIASKEYILELRAAVQSQTRLSSQPKWVRLALGID